MFPGTGTQLETAEVATLTSDYSEALKGVSAVIHCAAPTYVNGATTEDILEVSLSMCTICWISY